MRFLIAAILLASSLWAGYWWFGSGKEEDGIRAWFDRHDYARYGAVSIAGFPNRFDSHITEPEITGPNGGFAWSAPFLDLLRMSYQPGHYILVFADMQKLTLGGQTIGIETTDADASAVFKRDGSLDRSSFVLQGVGLMGPNWTANCELLHFASESNGDGSHTIWLQAANLHRTDGTVPPVNVTIRATGQVALNERGELTGELTLTAPDMTAALQLATDFGWLPASTANELALATGDLVLKFEAGEVTIGNRPLNRAPQLPLLFE
ncbi:DUF2125 domain-containing protein [Pseudoruegeria sp. HB172150]|uniref:DUF2125 domain-containing protein n=1 Tax=Pseudoruegeria sp. HB172150 TaxID=2721164 RepID=UPI001551D338|nr:DUF2125 domain-containing protein [Pseudoruegeria sp. HB172150]